MLRLILELLFSQKNIYYPRKGGTTVCAPEKTKNQMEIFRIPIVNYSLLSFIFSGANTQVRPYRFQRLHDKFAAIAILPRKAQVDKLY